MKKLEIIVLVLLIISPLFLKAQIDTVNTFNGKNSFKSPVSQYVAEADSNAKTHPISFPAYHVNAIHDEILIISGYLHIQQDQTTHLYFRVGLTGSWGFSTAYAFAGTWRGGINGNSNYSLDQVRVKAGSWVYVSINVSGLLIGAIMFNAGYDIRLVRYAN